MTNYVSVPGSSGCVAVHHTDPDCQRIKGDYREVSDRFVQWHDTTVCQWCEDMPEAAKGNL